ncbi:MAG: flagellar hook capping FlgD N-terminal domain-containing protein [Acetivibrionales bacterium]|jgi:flagellar basal-body rod modification protein FlgD
MPIGSATDAGNQKTIEQIIEAQAEANTSTRNTGELGKDDFLKLLITQVQYQDPLNPQSDTEFIAQLAQFSSLEQMQNLNRSFSYSTGFALMGKYISAEIDGKDGKVKFVDGRVDSIRMMNGEVFAVVGEDDVPLDKISWVSDASIGSHGDVTEYSGIIGMLAKAHILNAEGKIGSIEGIISTVVKEPGGIYARLDEVEIKPQNLDLGDYESVDDYVEVMAGQELIFRYEDELTGEKFEVMGILRAGYTGQDGEIRLILDDIKVPANNIYSTKKIDLLSTEQMLLSEILKELRKLNPTEYPPEDDIEELTDETTDTTDEITDEIIDETTGETSEEIINDSSDETNPTDEE